MDNNNNIITRYVNRYNQLEHWRKTLLFLISIVYFSFYCTIISIYEYKSISNIFIAFIYFFVGPFIFINLCRILEIFSTILFREKKVEKENNTEKLKNDIFDIHNYVIESNEICVLCLENKIEIILNCHKNHTGCSKCIVEWCKRSNTCPFCRQIILEKDNK